MLRDTVFADDSQDTRTHKIFRALDQVCYEFDLGKPIWLEATVTEFKRHKKARFRQDNFIEEIPFDYLEIQVIEEDWDVNNKLKTAVRRDGSLFLQKALTFSNARCSI